jgi:hypothetical protein
MLDGCDGLVKKQLCEPKLQGFFLFEIAQENLGTQFYFVWIR